VAAFPSDWVSACVGVLKNRSIAYHSRLQRQRDTDFATVIESDVPIVVQQTRLDSRQAENALISTIAYPAGE
jgi:hypothetical protein